MRFNWSQSSVENQKDISVQLHALCVCEKSVSFVDAGLSYVCISFFSENTNYMQTMGAAPICWSLVMLATPPLTFSSLAKTFTEPPSGESSSFWDEDDDGIQLEVKYHQ